MAPHSFGQTFLITAPLALEGMFSS
jgi:hypothetical protein